MNDSEVIDIFESVFKSEGHGYGDVSDLLRMIDSIENALEGRYWRIKNVVGIFNDLYEGANENRSLLRPYKKELQALYERENAQQKILRQDLRNTISGKPDKIVDSSFGADFVRRAIAMRNAPARSQTCTSLLEALEALRNHLRTSNFDPSEAATIVAGNDKNRVREYATEFAWHLKCRGWHEDDIDEIPKRMNRTSKAIPVYLSQCATQTEKEYECIVFIPDIQLGFNAPRSFIGGQITVYPATSIAIDELNDIHELPSQLREYVADRLDADACIKFSVSAFGRKGAAHKIANQTAEFLDACSCIASNADLKQPQYSSDLTRIIWDLDGTSGPCLQNHSRSGRHAFFEADHMDTIAELLWGIHKCDNSIADRLARAIHFFRRSNLSGPTIDTVINRIACLETIVTQGYSKKRQVIDDAMELSGVYEDSLDQVEASLSRLYNIRNAALHSGRVEMMSDPAVTTALQTAQSILRTVIFEMNEHLQTGGQGDIRSLQHQINCRLDQRRQSVSWKLYRDCIRVGRNYRLEGELVDENNQRIVDARGNFRVEIEGRFVKIHCDYALVNRSSVSYASPDHLYFSGVVNGRRIQLRDPIFGGQIIFQSSVHLLHHNYDRVRPDVKSILR